MATEPKSDGTITTSQPGSRSGPVIERAPLSIVEVQGAAHTVSYVNSAFCRLLGKSKAELVGRPFPEIVPGGRNCVPILDQVYRTGEPVSHEQDVDAEAEPARWLYAMWPALDASDRPAGVIIQLTKADVFRQNAAAINEALLVSALHQHELAAEAVTLNAQLAREIADRKEAETALTEANRRLADQAGELERLVAERTETLRETVAELEGFSYSVAHNMRAPLRGMQGFARILLDEHSGQLNAVARDHLERIAGSAARMDMLIQDVLNYTHVLRSDALLTPVDLNRLVRDVIASYPDWRSPKIEIQIDGPLPRVLGHEGFLAQCISNLVSNAVKFSAIGVTPHLRIWAADPWIFDARASARAEPGAAAGSGDESFVRLWFEDNGIGIAAKDRRRVFRMFDRLNSADEFEGTGIGLTIVRKAVERMGGRIDFESEPGIGSKFWITLKKAPDLASTEAEPVSPPAGILAEHI